MPRIVHTGQHYDANMSDTFFEDLQLPKPQVHLGVGSGSHAEQTGKVMIEYEKVCLESRPDWIVVVGDVNSTLACALVGAKLLIPVAHREAGLRSGDRTMPEEINRIATDAVAEGGLPLVFPLHPRTRARLEEFGLMSRLAGDGGTAIRLLEPLSYVQFMSLIVDCRVAITDSGGIQEETSYLGIPCLTLRDNTERPITIRVGTNRLVKPAELQDALDVALASECERPVIELWDGKTAGRVAESLRSRC